MPKGSVKIMLSYDYNHFEICLSSDEEMDLNKINEMAKDAHRLVDKAKNRYILQKKYEQKRFDLENCANDLNKEVKIIKENYPQTEWTPEQKAKVKKLENINFWLSEYYDYQDDWDDYGQL